MRLRFAALAAAFALASCGGGGGTVGSLPAQPTAPPSQAPLVTPTPGVPVQIQRISADPFSNPGAQHQTEVEPDAAVHGATIVSVFQTGRFFSPGGSSDIGVEASTNGGATWSTPGFLPSLTKVVDPSTAFDSVSDPVVAYDAKRSQWLAASLPIQFLPNHGSVAPQLDVSHSTDGVTWSTPNAIAVPDSDKEWVVCDNSGSSPYFGRCYMEWDNPSQGPGDVIHMAASLDGGSTWSIYGGAIGSGIGGQPVVLPNGKVVVPIDDGNEMNVDVFASSDGGTTWSPQALIFSIIDHRVAGNLRSGPLVSATTDASGKIYVVWQDCRFRAGCTSNDIVLTTSTDGSVWSPPVRLPEDATNSSVDHFTPVIAIDPATSGSSAHVSVEYYSYLSTTCIPSCALTPQVISSIDGGATWTAPKWLAAPMEPTWLANTDNGGYMFGDYGALVYSNGRPIAVFADATAPTPAFNEAMNAPIPGAIYAQSILTRRPVDTKPVPGVHRDPGPRPRP